MKIALTEHNNGDWSFQSLPWEGLQELIVCYVGPQLVISQKKLHITLSGEQKMKHS